MSGAPTGFNAPKTNWTTTDPINPPDLNRIEGNANATETGNRTLDQTLANPANVGTLRQILSWFAGRIQAITGAANWWDAPATTLQAASAHHAAAAPHSGHETSTGAQARVDAHAVGTAVHGAVVAPTANLLVLRDANGRAQVAAPSVAADIARLDTVTAHTNLTNNPHGVTAAQVGAAPFTRRVARTSNIVLGAADSGWIIDITSGTFTQTFAAAATLGNGWSCYIRNSGTGDITLDPNGAETINGLTSFVMYPGEMRLITCDGVALFSVVLNSFSRTFLTSGTFVRPPGYAMFFVLARGGGGGGGGGALVGNTSWDTGGAGGGGGGEHRVFVHAAAVGATVAVTIGAGGIGGPSIGGTFDTGGLPGSAGGDSVFGDYFAVGNGGGGGGGGRNIGASFAGGAGPGSHLYEGGRGGSGGANGSASLFSGSGGGGGGGMSSGAWWAGAGGGGGTLGGTTSGASGAHGTGRNGGGGGAGNGGTGGNGGPLAGGGGGGGSAANFATAGAGGHGGNGQVTLVGVV